MAKTREAQALKEQVDAACQKEVGLKARIQPWIKEAFTGTAMIEENLAQMQDTCALRQEGASNNDASESHTQLIKWTAKECVADINEAQKSLEGLCANITTLAE